MQWYGDVVSPPTVEVLVTMLSTTVGAAMPNMALKPGAVAVPALSSHVRPALVLAERESRELLDAAAMKDVLRGGVFLTSPVCIQVWDRPWAGGDRPDGAVHLGSVDWSYDTPVKHYVTIYRAMITDDGVAAGETTLSILGRVLGLTGLPVDGARVTMPMPPRRDPFRR
jgi:hypothetical protein